MKLSAVQLRLTMRLWQLAIFYESIFAIKFSPIKYFQF